MAELAQVSAGSLLFGHDDEGAFFVWSIRTGCKITDIRNEAEPRIAVTVTVLVGKYVFNVFGLGHCIHVYTCI